MGFIGKVSLHHFAAKAQPLSQSAADVILSEAQAAFSRAELEPAPCVRMHLNRWIACPSQQSSPRLDTLP